MNATTIFYAWQSDVDSTSTRYFIRDAAKIAAKGLTSSLEVGDAPRIDSDTRDVSGTPDISSTIFEKINRSAVFLADVTFVGKTPNGKLLPNPNVLIELGFAAKSIGWERIVLVMNKDFGDPSELPFDLRTRRFPISFSPLADSKQKVAKSLQQQLQLVLAGNHEGVERTLKRLDVASLVFVRDHKDCESIQVNVGFVGENGASMAEKRRSAIRRLLDFEVLEYELDSHLYRWTHFGRVIKEKIISRFKDDQKLR